MTLGDESNDPNLRKRGTPGKGGASVKRRTLSLKDRLGDHKRWLVGLFRNSNAVAIRAAIPRGRHNEVADPDANCQF